MLRPIWELPASPGVGAKILGDLLVLCLLSSCHPPFSGIASCSSLSGLFLVPPSLMFPEPSSLPSACGISPFRVLSYTAPSPGIGLGPSLLSCRPLLPGLREDPTAHPNPLLFLVCLPGGFQCCVTSCTCICLLSASAC